MKYLLRGYIFHKFNNKIYFRTRKFIDFNRDEPHEWIAFNIFKGWRGISYCFGSSLMGSQTIINSSDTLLKVIIAPYLTKIEAKK